jgi:two-component system osmolarity sensor histidine kinase EnvZ
MTRQKWRDLRYKLLPKTLFGRSLMIIVTPILLLQMIVAFIFFDRHWDSMSDRLVTALSGEVHLLSSQLLTAKTDQARQTVIDQAAKSMEIMITLSPATPDALKQGSSGFKAKYWFMVDDKLRAKIAQKLLLPFALHAHEKPGWFEITVQLDNKTIAHFVCPERRLTTPTTYIFILWLIGSAVILFGIAIVFMRNQIRPIMRLAVAAEKFGKGQDVPDFRPVGASEVRRASTAFLGMKERLKRQIEQRTAMLSGVSHDLRTPLTRMKLQLAMMKEDAGIENIRQDVDEMEKMVEGFLAFAKGEGDETPEITDLASLNTRIAANARRQGKEIELSQPPKMMIRVRPMAIERAIANIITNGGKFAQHVWLTAVETPESIMITIDDDGPGIPEEFRADVFRPFYRIEKSRNKKTGGIGLGLSIAQDIIHAHGGKIELQDSPRGGLRVMISLPF